MIRILSVLIATGLVALSACTSLIAPVLTPDVTTDAAKIEGGDWTLDTKHAALRFEINHLGFAVYHGRFEAFDAKLQGDPASPEKSALTATIQVASLDVANDDFAKTLIGPDWLDATKFPTATFRSTGVKRTGPTTADIDGLLTLRGVTQPITLKANFNGAAPDRLRGTDVAGFSAETTLRRSAFGVSKFSGVLADEVTLKIDAEFMRAKE